MKKAKVIIPSLALLSFSALACVTGSVAWFSSITNAHLATSSFKVKAIVGSMDISVYNGCGTRVICDNASTDAPTADQTIKDKDGNVIGYKKREDIRVVPANFGTDNEYQLSHGSYDPDTQTAYTWAGGGYTVVGKESVYPQTQAGENHYLEQKTEGVFNIFTWKMEFEYDFKGAGEGAKNLYIDVDKIVFNETTTVGATSPDTARGFRMFFLTMDSTTNTVLDWTCISPFQDKLYDRNFVGESTTEHAPSSYVKDASGTPTETAFDPALTGNLIYSATRDGQNFDISNVEGKGPHDRKDCVGTFSTGALVPSTTVSRITLKVVCVYEGCDNNVEFESTMNAVGSSLDFYVADDTGASA